MNHLLRYSGVNSAEAFNKLGDAYFFAGSFNEAIGSYKEAARVQPKQPDAYYNLGLAYLEIGDHESAMAQSRVLEALDVELNKKLLAEFQR
jgi:tetratricopeptide (TPR) repeat protein